jgi:peptidyl-prolyl cis-trans isomerase B (cyclophilin B)
MANTGQPDSGGSQFFIVYQDTQLPPAYTVFGTVDADAVAAVQKVADAGSTPPGDGAPNTPVTITGVTVD